MRKKVIFILLFFTPCITISKIIDWKECVKIISSENLEIKAAKEAIEKREFDYISQRSAFFPNLSNSINYSKEKSGNDTYSFFLTSNFTIFNGFNDFYSLKQADLLVKKEKENLRRTTSLIYYSVRETFIELLYLEKLLELNMKIEKRRENNMKMVNLKYLGGREDKGSYFRTQAQYENSIYEVSKAKRDIEKALNKLSYYLGGISISGVKGDMGLITPPRDIPNFDALSTLTPQYLSSKYDVEILSRKKSQCISTFLPSLSLSANYGKRGDKFFPQNEHWSIEGSMRISIFEGFSRYYDCKSATKELVKAELTLDNYRLSVRESLREAFFGFIDAFEKAKVQEKTLQATALMAKVLKAKYEQGLTSFTNWDLIENDLIRDEKLVLAYRKEMLTSYANWLKETGNWE